MWAWATGSAPPEEEEDDEVYRGEGEVREGVRLFDDGDFERFSSLMNSTAEWTLAGGPASSMEDMEVDQVKVERRPCPMGKYFDVFRITCVVDAAPFGGAENAVKQLSSVLLDSAYRKSWDARCACNGTLAKLGRANYVGFYGGLAPSPISSRDFCTLKSWRYNYGEEMRNIFVNHSVKWNSFPPQESYIRARSFQTGNILSMRSSDGNVTLQYLTQSDIKGWIPAYVVGYVTQTGAPEMMRKIVQAAKSYPEWLAKNDKEAAYDLLDPEKDSDEVKHYDESYRY